MRRLTAAILLLMAGNAPWGPAAAEVALPTIGDPARSVFTPAEERELRDTFLREIRKQLAIVEDPEINAYVKSLGHRLAAATDRPGQPFLFLVVDDPAINAFAGPGGVIAVNTGLILAATAESEVAAVVAHEIAHVTQRHLARAYAQASRSTVPSIAAMLAAVILATQNPAAGQAAIASVAARSAQKQIDFTRANEKEADRVGIGLLARAGFDPRAMPSFFEQLQQSNRFSREAPEFLSTHPVTTSRIADSRNRAEQYPYRQVADSLNFHLIRAKLRVRHAQNPGAAIAHFEAALANGRFRNELAARYGLALALVSAQRWTQARTQLMALLRKDPDRIPFRMALAEVESALGRRDVALAIYEETVAVFPTHRPAVVAYASSLLDAGRYDRALKVLADYRRLRGPDADLYQLEAEAESRLGKRFESAVALAEHHYLNGDLDAAIFQLGRALAEGSADYYGTSRAEARLKQLREEKTARTRDSHRR